jgi:hypothetical protein
MTDHLAIAKEQLNNYGENYALNIALGSLHAQIAIAELLEKQQKPLEIRIDPKVVVSVPKPVDPRDTAYVPGDMVGLTISGDNFTNFNGLHGVVVYGPDDDRRPGWVVSTALGNIRCAPDDLTMITRREDRTTETDAAAYKWKDKL